MSEVTSAGAANGDAPRECTPRVAFVTLGCKVNQAESETIAELLGGDEQCCASRDADVVVVNTCTVTGEADRKARKAVRHALGLPRAPVVVVTGCLATLDARGLRALGERVVVEADKERVASRVQECLGSRESGDIADDFTRRIILDSGGATGDIAGESPGSKGDIGADSAGDIAAGAAREETGACEGAGPIARAAIPSRSRTRVQLKVEDGCDAFCTYCIVPFARGAPRPVPLEAIVDRASRLVCFGVPEIVLTGINIGRYHDRGAGLPELLEAVATTRIARIRLSSVEPGDVDDRLLAVAARTPAFCRHVHVPLQSGSDSVLARMGRPYDTATFAEAVTRIRHALPEVAVSTDVIAGFPGETDAEAAETMAFVEEQGFSRLHVFRYSARDGTPAAAMSDQVAPSVRADRAAALRALGEHQAAAHAASRIGRTVELLVERVQEMVRDGRPGAWGVTREYLRAVVPDADASPGALLDVVVERLAADGSVICRVAR